MTKQEKITRKKAVKADSDEEKTTRVRRKRVVRKKKSSTAKKGEVALDVRVNGKVKRAKRVVRKPRKRLKKIKKDEELEISELEIEALKEKLIYERVEKNKMIMMWCGVGFFMLLIVFVWVYNVKKIFKPVEVGNEGVMEEWNEISNDISERMNTLQNDLKKVESFKDLSVDEGDGEIEGEGSEEPVVIFGERLQKEVEIELLKNKIEELEGDLENNNEE